MATAPKYTDTANIAWATISSANTALDGTGSPTLIHTADASNGSFVEKVRVRHKGTNVATVLRVFINNGSTPETATNNTLYTERTVAANTLSQVAESLEYELPINASLPASYRLYATIGTAVAAGLHVTAVGGDF